MPESVLVRSIGCLTRLVRLWCFRRQARHFASTGNPINVLRHGLRWELRGDRYVDREVALGLFERDTVRRLKDLATPGFHALDVGANFGYFTVLMASWFGPTGHVWASEPTRCYRDRLLRHLAINRLDERVTVLPYGLSNVAREARISIGVCSATMHDVEPDAASEFETIALRPLDDTIADLGIEKLDFVKVDIDGHEPAFIEGARRTLATFRPAMVIEFNQPNLEVAGSDVETLRALLEEMDYELRSERTGSPFPSRLDFMRECGNYSVSANVWAFPRIKVSR